LIETIVLVTSAERLSAAQLLAQEENWHKIIAIVAGGARRQDSVCSGLDALVEHAPDWVMIHDAARPFVTPSILEAGLQAVQQHPATIAAVPVKDTIKQVQQGIICATPDRSQLWAVQTPQVFAFPLIYQAHHSSAAEEDMTDDATLLERLGQRVTIFPGEYTNLKITTREDLFFAEALIKGNTL
jgi:2-C-methyl-D-erythritol 4-phosphate cytidylyltransferase